MKKEHFFDELKLFMAGHNNTSTSFEPRTLNLGSGCLPTRVVPFLTYACSTTKLGTADSQIGRH